MTIVTMMILVRLRDVLTFTPECLFKWDARKTVNVVMEVLGFGVHMCLHCIIKIICARVREVGGNVGHWRGNGADSDRNEDNINQGDKKHQPVKISEIYL